MKKQIIVTLTILLSIFLKSQVLDSIYFSINDYKIEKYNDYIIPNFSFSNPTIDFDTNILFSPNYNFTQYKSFEGFKLNGKVKKISKYQKKEFKHIYSTTDYNEKGLKIKSKDLEYIETYFNYDKLDRMTSKVRIVRNDTLFSEKYKYNSDNQLIQMDRIRFENKNKSTSIWIIDYKPDKSIHINYVKDDGTLETITIFRCKNNKVFIEYYLNGKLIDDIVELTYSENNNLIRYKSKDHTTYYSYDKYNRNNKIINFTHLSIFHYSYTNFFDSNGSIKKIIYESPIEKKINYVKINYDKMNNKIYENPLAENLKNNSEYFFDIVYY